MERSYSNNENLDDFSKPIEELKIQEKERKYSNINNNNKNNVICDKNSIDQIYYNKNNYKNNNNQNDLYMEQNQDLYDNYKYNRRKSKSSERKIVSNKKFIFNSSGNSEKEKTNNTMNLSKDIKYFYCNTSDVISEEGFSELNEHFTDYPRSGKTHNSNQFEKDIKNIDLNLNPINNIKDNNIDKNKIRNDHDFILFNFFKIYCGILL